MGRTAELRVHGVHGTPPETMLDDPTPRWIGGDSMGRIYRRREPVAVAGFQPRVVEGYHWGRYTAGSASRALWLLLLPFALLNLAHFALLSSPNSVAGRLAERLLRLLGLVLTLALVVTTCYLAWEIVGRQCGSTGCGDLPDFTHGFTDLDRELRMVIVALAPAVVITLLWSFGRRPPEFAPPGGGSSLEPLRADKNRPDKDRLGNSTFWLGAHTAAKQRAAHVTAACAASGVLALATVGSWQTWAPSVPAWAGAAYVILLTACAGAGLAALGIVVIDHQPKPKPTAERASRARRSWLPRKLSEWLHSGVGGLLKPDRWQRDSIKLPPWQTGLRWFATGTALACLGFAFLVARQSSPGPSAGSATFETAVAAVGLLAGVLLPVLLVVCGWLARDSYGKQVRLGGPEFDRPLVPSAFSPYYKGLGAVVLASMSVTVGFGFSTATVWWIASLLGTPDHPGGQLPNRVEVATGYWTSAMVWGGMTVALLVSAVPLAAWMLQRIKPWLLLADVVVILVAASGAVAIDSDAGLICRIVLLVAVLLAVAGVLLDGRGQYEDQAGEDYPAGPDFDGRARVARSWRIAMIRYRYHHALGAVATVGGLASLVWAGLCARAWWQGHSSPEPRVSVLTTSSFWDRLDLDLNTDRLVSSLTGLGVTSATVTAVGLTWLGYSTWRNPKIRTVTGILWDMLSFWPRVAHPLCPLPYGGRAVRALVVRTSQLLEDQLDVDGPEVRDGTAGRRNFDSVVLSGHSQGSVITLAACAVIRRCQSEDGVLTRAEAELVWPRLRMVTYGSQLQFIYSRMFPSYLGFQVQQDLYHDLGGHWRNLYRWTDPLGGPVLSWPLPGARRGERFGPNVTGWTTAGCPNGEACQPQPQQTSTRPEYLRWAHGPDIRLRDPGLIQESPYAPRVSALGHGDYPTDPGFDEVVAQLGADQAPSVRCHGNHTWPEDAPIPQQAPTSAAASQLETEPLPATEPVPTAKPSPEAEPLVTEGPAPVPATEAEPKPENVATDRAEPGH